MNELKAMVESSEPKKKYTFSKRITKGETTKELEVKEVENGFVIEITESGYRGTGKDKDWYHDTKKYISETNPLATKSTTESKEDKKESKTILDVINSIDNF